MFPRALLSIVLLVIFIVSFSFSVSCGTGGISAGTSYSCGPVESGCTSSPNSNTVPQPSCGAWSACTNGLHSQTCTNYYGNCGDVSGSGCSPTGHCNAWISDSTSTQTESCCTPLTEICDGADNDCDGSVDENGVCVCFAPQSSECTAGDLANRDCYSCADNEYFDVNNIRYCLDYSTGKDMTAKDTACKGYSFAGYTTVGMTNFTANVSSTSERLQHILTVKGNYAPNRLPCSISTYPLGLQINDTCNQLVSAFPAATYPYLYSDGGKLGRINCSVSSMAFTSFVLEKCIDENARMNDGGGSDFGAVCQFKRTNAANCYYCTGEAEATGAAVVCDGDDSNLTANTSRTMVSSKSACTAAAKCQYYCKEGYAYVGGACVATKYSCTETIDANAIMCDYDDQNLSAPTPRTVVNSCTDASKCEYYCKERYEISGSSCTEIPVGLFLCTGEMPSNAVLCTNDNQGLLANANRKLVGSTSYSCTLKDKCEYYCASGYGFNNGLCVVSSVPGGTGTLIDPTGGAKSIEIFEGTLDGNKISGSIKCSSNLDANLLFVGANGQSIPMTQTKIPCPLIKSDFTVSSTLGLDENTIYNLTATIPAPCDICSKTITLAPKQKEIQASIPDNSVFLALAVAMISIALISMASKKRQIKQI
ncbi:MAG: hypothetical protein AABW59_01290 [archaeon]